MVDRIRTVLCLAAAIAAGSPGAALAAKKLTTGACVCRNGGNVLATYSAQVCVQANHDGCSSAKQTCVTSNQAACGLLGGILGQSSKTCSVGSKC